MNNDPNGILVLVPIGTVLKHNIFFYSGAKIPVRVENIGYSEGFIDTKVKDYGINNTLVEIYARFVLKEKIIFLPTVLTMRWW
jgi:hypothetical protein